MALAADPQMGALWCSWRRGPRRANERWSQCLMVPGAESLKGPRRRACGVGGRGHKHASTRSLGRGRLQALQLEADPLSPSRCAEGGCSPLPPSSLPAPGAPPEGHGEPHSHHHQRHPAILGSKALVEIGPDLKRQENQLKPRRGKPEGGSGNFLPPRRLLAGPWPRSLA